MKDLSDLSDHPKHLLGQSLSDLSDLLRQDNPADLPSRSVHAHPSGQLLISRSDLLGLEPCSLRLLARLRRLGQLRPGLSDQSHLLGQLRPSDLASLDHLQDRSHQRRLGRLDL